MRVFITGATGFLGRRVTDLLLRESLYDICIICRKRNAMQFFPKHKRLHIYTADVTIKQSLTICREVIGPVDAVVHLASHVPKDANDDDMMKAYGVNLFGTINLFETFAGSTKHIVLASTAEVYGLPKAKKKITETFPTDPPSFYAASKLAAELFAKTFSKKTKIPVTTLRFSVIYGANDPISRAIPNFVRQAVTNVPITLFGGDELRDYIHIDDAARAVFFALRYPTNELFNIGSGQATKVSDAARIIAEKANSHSKIITKKRKKAKADIVLDIRKAKKVLQFTPTHRFPYGIEEIIAQARRVTNVPQS